MSILKKVVLQANLSRHDYIQPNQFLVNFDLEIVEILANIFVFWGVSSKYLVCKTPTFLVQHFPTN